MFKQKGKTTIKLLIISSLLLWSTFANAEVLVMSPSGTHTTKMTLAEASTAADVAGKTVVVTSGQVITTAVTWPADRKLKFEKNGSVSFTGSGALTGLKEARPEWFGINGLGNAIASLAAGGVLRFSGGIYALNSAVNGTLSGVQKWIAEAPSTIKYTGAETHYLVLLELNGNAFSIEGSLTFDANQKARHALRVNNSSKTMATATDLMFDGVKGINAYSTDTVRNIGSGGLFIYGGFNKVYLRNCIASNISRAVGVGKPGVSSSIGIAVTHGGVNKYAREVIIEDAYIDTITSQEADRSANNLDADGLAVLGPKGLDTSLIVKGGKFINCRGRSIKSQMEQNLIDGAIFIRNPDAVRTILNGLEVDFQFGSGVLKNFKCNYSAIKGNISPFGKSFSIVNATVRNVTSLSMPAAGEGVVMIDSGEIINNVPINKGSIPYFFVPSSPFNEGATGKFASVSIKNVKFLGLGQINNFVYGNLGAVRKLTTSNNFFQRISGYLVYSTKDAASCRWVAQNNTITNDSRALRWAASEGSPPILINLN